MSPNTGQANIIIPLYSMSRGNVTFPISIGYATGGIKVKDGHGTAGMGWNLIAGGRITRDLRGLPDDHNSGWLNNTNGTKINNFTIANDNNKSTCADETADNTYINNNFGDNSDTEPDVFSVTAPGLSCHFVFDNNHLIKTIPYQDVNITYTQNVQGQIITFTIVNDQGVKYQFTGVESVTMSATTDNPNNIRFFKTNYNLYKNQVTYNTTWHLTSINDPGGNGVSLGYTDYGNRTGASPIVLTLSDPGNLNHKVYQYSTVTIRNNYLLLNSIRSAKDTAKIAIDYTPVNGSNEFLVYNVRGGGRDILFDYGRSNNINGFERSFLTGLSDRAVNSPLKYKFNYIGYTNFSSFSETNDFLPDTSSKQIDYWGYYSKTLQSSSLSPALYINSGSPNFPTYKIQGSTDVGSFYNYAITGSARVADADHAMTGTLNKITYAEGGTTTLSYELNDYYDPSTTTVIAGGGIRVKSITDFDGINVLNNNTRTYSYVNPITNLSSGSPVTLPAYAFTRSYVGTGSAADLWKYSTVSSENDLSSEDKSILYSHITVFQLNSGKILYEYSKPGIVWDVNTIPDWNPTINNISRSDCSVLDYTKNDIYSYPFAPNTNYDFERGILKKTTNYNKYSQIVSESIYNYTRTGPPVVVTGLRIDYNMTNKVYAKYNLYTTCGELMTKETKILYDYDQLTPHTQTSTLDYSYDSPYHKLMTQQTAVNSDGSIFETRTTYVKDYIIPSTTDSNLLAIDKLRLLHVNIPVEKQFSVKRNGIRKTIGAELTRFRSVPGILNATLELPAQKLSFSSANGVTDFQPFSTTSAVSVMDSRYIPTQNYTKYDVYGSLMTKDDNNKNVETYFTDRFVGLPSVHVINAGYNEVAATDFDSNHSGNNFGKAVTPYTYTNDSHSGNRALVLNAMETMSSNIHKNADALNYIFSCWLNTTATSTMNVTLNSNGTNINYPLNVSNSLGKWKYYEVKVPVGTIAANFSINIQCANQVKIDDILFYPENASVENVTYDIITRQKTSETNVNGIISYYSYDPYGRLLSVADQDKQILMKKSYVKHDVTSTPPTGFVSPDFYSSYQSITQSIQRLITFNNTSVVNSPEVGEIIYTWNFGDGTAAVTGLNSTHVYTTPGTYTVTLTATSSSAGQLTYSRQLVISDLPAATTRLTYTNLSLGGTITNITLKQGSHIVSSIKGAFLTLGNYYIVADKYTIEVTVTGTNANYNSMTYSRLGISKICFSNGVGNSTAVYSLSDDLRNVTQADFKIDINPCGGGEIDPD